MPVLQTFKCPGKVYISKSEFSNWLVSCLLSRAISGPLHPTPCAWALTVRKSAHECGSRPGQGSWQQLSCAHGHGKMCVFMLPWVWLTSREVLKSLAKTSLLYDQRTRFPNNKVSQRRFWDPDTVLAWWPRTGRLILQKSAAFWLYWKFVSNGSISLKIFLLTIPAWRGWYCFHYISEEKALLRQSYPKPYWKRSGWDIK